MADGMFFAKKLQLKSASDFRLGLKSLLLWCKFMTSILRGEGGFSGPLRKNCPAEHINARAMSIILGCW